jgi:hypothetical protein
MIYKISCSLFIFHLTLLLYLSSVSNAQDWPKIYGDNFNATIANMAETYDQGFLLSAYTYTGAGWPLRDWVIKIDINGNVLWEKQFGNGMYSNGVSDSKITSDHGIILAASSGKYSGNYDPTFIKLNVCGELEWCRVFQSPDDNYGTGILQLSDGSYIGMLQYYGEGETYARISLVKIDQNGEPIWIQKQAQEDTLIYNEEGSNLILTSSGNFLISGSCNHPGWRPYFILTDTSGIQNWDIIWSSAYGHAFQTIEHRPGTFYSTGFKLPPGLNNMPAVFKFDGNGNQLDDFLILGDTVYQGGGGSILTIDDSTLCTGIVWSSVNNLQLFKSEIVKIDTIGNLINMRLLLVEDRAPTSMLLTSDNKVLAAGSYVTDSNWDIYLWKMNTDLEDDTLYTQPLIYDSLCPYEIQSDIIDLDCGVFVNIAELPTKEEYESSIKISPNPAREWVVLTLPDVLASGAFEMVVYDIFGREARRRGCGEAERHGGKEAGKQGGGIVEPVNRMISFDVSDFSPGMYVAVVKDRKGRKFTGKFVVIK